MQFGRLVGICLISLGVLLLVLQSVFYVSTRKGNPSQPANPPQATKQPEREVSKVPAVVGAASLIAGIVLFRTARRRDEPDPKHAVK